MARTRALLTEADRNAIRGDVEDSNRQYQAVSRVRSRIRDELPADVELLEQHHPELYAELVEVVCEE